MKHAEKLIKEHCVSTEYRQLT